MEVNLKPSLPIFPTISYPKMPNVDLHFSRASPLDRRDSLFICEKLILEKLESPLILFFLKGKIKQEIKP